MIRWTLLFLSFLSTSAWGQLTRQSDSIASHLDHQGFEASVHTSPIRAKAHLDNLKVIAERKLYPKARYYYQHDLAYSYFAQGKMNPSELHFKNAFEIARSYGWNVDAISSKIWLANHHYFKNEIDSARVILNEIINESQAIDYTDGIAGGLYGLMSTENNEEVMLMLLLKIDSVYKEKNSISPILSNSYGAIASIYLKSFKNRDLAYEYYQKALDVAKKTNYSPGITNNGVVMGQMALKDGNLKDAYTYLEEFLNHSITINDSVNIAHGQSELASVDIASGNLTQAKKRLTAAEEIYKRNHDSVALTSTRIKLASLSVRLKNAPQAKRYIEYVKQFPNTMSEMDTKIRTVEVEAGYYELTKDFGKAIEKLKTLDSLKKIQLDNKNSEAFLELQQRHRAKEKEREISLLKAENLLKEQQKRSQRNFLLGGLGLTALVGLFFFFQYRNRQKTNEKLKELDIAKSTFFANISHEFRTPLTLIKGPLEDQLASNKLSPNERNNLRTASNNANRLESLVEQLLALSRLESGNLKLRVQPGNLSQFIKVQLEAFSFVINERQLVLTIDLPTDNNTDWFDRESLEKVLFNLIGNAIKYTPEKGIIAVEGNRNKDQYAFTITNTSDDLNEIDRNLIFERFYQANSQNVGTGIGLALTKELVELHKGVISMPKSEKGSTKFTVKLNTSKTVYSPEEILSEELQHEEYSISSQFEEITEESVVHKEGAPILLIVDDNAEIRNYISTIFENTFNVQTAQNGNEGFEKALELVPDIIISDVMMPVEDGFALTKRIKINEITSHIPVVLLTAKTEDSDKLTGVETGADVYVTKPFNSELLRATINNLLEGRRQLQKRFAQEVILKPKEISVSSVDEKFIERLQFIFDEQLTNPDFSVATLGKEMAVSRMQLHRKLKALTGQSTSEFIRSQRLKLAIQLLKEHKISVSEVGYSVGFNDPSYFTKCFKKEYGVSPSEYDQS